MGQHRQHRRCTGTGCVGGPLHLARRWDRRSIRRHRPVDRPLGGRCVHRGQLGSAVLDDIGILTKPDVAAYVAEAGEYSRDQDYITTRITADGRDGYPVEPGRYRLVVARACPWANRSIIVRRLLGLEDVLSMGVTGPTHDVRSWTFDLDPGGRDPVLGIERIQDAYFARFPGYDRGITVPAIVDVPSGQVVTNDFARMTLDLSIEWRAYHRP